MKKEIETLIYLSCPDWADDEEIIHTRLKNFRGQVPNVGDYIELQEEDLSDCLFVVSSRIFAFDDCVPPIYEGLTLNLVKIDFPIQTK